MQRYWKSPRVPQGTPKHICGQLDLTRVNAYVHNTLSVVLEGRKYHRYSVLVPNAAPANSR